MANKRKRKISTASKAIKPTEDLKIFYIDSIIKRLWMVVNYLTILITSAVVFGFSALCEYFLYRLIWYFLGPDIEKVNLIPNLQNWVQLAIVLVSFLGMIIHTGFSIYGQIQVERQFMEGE